MADSVVTFLLQNLAQLLAQESNLQGGVRDQVSSLQRELILINGFLENTEGKRQDNSVKEVVKQIRDEAYEAEDVIDTYIITVTEHRRRSNLGKLIHYFDRAITFHELASKIERIKIINREITENMSRYGIEIAESPRVDAEAEEMLRNRRKRVEVDQVVGFAHDAEELVKKLTEGSLQRNVVSIIGMGGLGKTTLARKIYNNNMVNNYFDFRGWVDVSQEYRIRELLLEILKRLITLPRLVMFRAELKEELLHGLEAKYSLNEEKLKGTQILDLKLIKEMNDEEFMKAWSKFLQSIVEDDCTVTKGKREMQDLKISLSDFMLDFYKKNGVKLQDMSVDELKSVLLESLKDRRYLIVMDDIWDTAVWNEVSTAFSNNSNGSRILITTRLKQVALSASSVNNSGPPIDPYEPSVLSEDESWELFSKKVFWEGTCPTDLETLGKQLVKSCHGLPLAIVVLGGLLASKEKTYRMWLKYVGHVTSFLSEAEASCIDILALSYNHLPCHLKPCFLYFGIYPEDFEIPVRQLIRLWIAEGFIRQKGTRNLEDIAEDYLEDLIYRSLIQVATKRLDGGVKTCRIHDLLRDLCILESSEEKFLVVFSHVNLPPQGESRRISIHYGDNPDISSSPCEPSNSRSIIVFRGVVEHECPVDKSYLKRIRKSNKLIRVVELGNMGICCLIPKGIEKLVLLRYLSIASGELIPDSICNLWNLETLDMRNSKMKTKCLPKGIWKLQRLRNLYLDGPAYLPRTKKNTTALPNLQVLTGIVINEDTENHFAKNRFPNLRKLGLHSSTGVESWILSCPHLCHLQTLKIYRLSDFSSPTSISLTLTKITLVDACLLSPAIMVVLGSLTKLRILKLRGLADRPNNSVLNCNVRSFQQLVLFKMANLQVSEWKLGQGAMPNLQRLVIERCELSRMLPDELWCLSAMRDVEVLHPHPGLARRLHQLQNQMRDGCKLHVDPPLNPTN